MASGVLPAENGETLESFDSSEFSLISEPPQEEVGLYYLTNSTALQADLMSARLDLSEEEIQRKLYELAEDNKKLKEALQLSRARMRSELSSIAAWHNNITTNMAATQVTLQEAQARIQELEQEKEELMRRNKEEEGQAIETMQNMYEESELEKSDLKSKLVNQEELNSRNDELLLNHAKEYQEKTNAMQAEHGRITAKLQEQIKSLEEKLRRYDEFLLNLAKDYQENTITMQAEHGKMTAKLQQQIKSLEEKLSSETRTVETDHVFATKKLEKVRAKYDFGGSECGDPEDLPFKKGEILTVISKDEGQWWTVKNSLGQTGSVPVPYIEQVDDNFMPDEVQNTPPPTSGQTQQSSTDPTRCNTANIQFFDYERLENLLLLIVDEGEKDKFVQRIGLYLLNNLACQVDGIERKLVGDQGVITLMLQVIKRRLEQGICDEVMKTAWHTMCYVTDSTPINCARFLEGKGMDLFLGCLDAFPIEPFPLREMMIILENVAEVKELRYYLMKDEYLTVFYKLLSSKSDGINVSCNAAGILSHIASDGLEPWANVTALKREDVLNEIVNSIEKWNLNTKRNIKYNFFTPILRLLTVDHTPEVQHWAAWVLANLTKVYPEQYCSLLKEEGGIELLKDILRSPSNPRIHELANMSIQNCLGFSEEKDQPGKCEGLLVIDLRGISTLP